MLTISRPLPSYDFVVGALATLVVVVLHKIWSVCNAQSLERIQYIANAPVSHAGDDDQITVWGENEASDELYAKGNTDFSPFVLRVEAYLRLKKLPYIKKSTKDKKENPRHKVPFANIKGTMVDDSGRIIEVIQNKFALNDEEQLLSEQQKMQGHLIRTMLFDSLYWVVAYAGFETNTGRNYVDELLKEAPIPAAMRPVVSRTIYNLEHANLYGQGYGRYPEEYIFQKGKDDVRALATALGDNKYILGTDEPTVYDTDVYPFLLCVFDELFALDFEWAREAKEEHKNLVEYLDRMKQILFPPRTSSEHQ